MTEDSHNHHRIICQMVGRFHVGCSGLTIIREIINCSLIDKYKTFKGWPKETRRKFIADVLACHRENLDLYKFVMGGCSNRSKKDRKRTTADVLLEG